MGVDWTRFERHVEPYEGRTVSQYEIPSGEDLETLVNRLKEAPEGIVLDLDAVSSIFSVAKKDLPKPNSIAQALRKKMGKVNVQVGIVGQKDNKGGRIRLRLKE